MTTCFDSNVTGCVLWLVLAPTAASVSVWFDYSHFLYVWEWMAWSCSGVCVYFFLWLVTLSGGHTSWHCVHCVSLWKCWCAILAALLQSWSLLENQYVLRLLSHHAHNHVDINFIAGENWALCRTFKCTLEHQWCSPVEQGELRPDQDVQDWGEKKPSQLQPWNPSWL